MPCNRPAGKRGALFGEFSRQRKKKKKEGGGGVCAPGVYLRNNPSPVHGLMMAFGHGQGKEGGEERKEGTLVPQSSRGAIHPGGSERGSRYLSREDSCSVMQKEKKKGRKGGQVPGSVALDTMRSMHSNASPPSVRENYRHVLTRCELEREGERKNKKNRDKRLSVTAAVDQLILSSPAWRRKRRREKRVLGLVCHTRRSLQSSFDSSQGGSDRTNFLPRLPKRKEEKKKWILEMEWGLLLPIPPWCSVPKGGGCVLVTMLHPRPKPWDEKEKVGRKKLMTSPAIPFVIEGGFDSVVIFIFWKKRKGGEKEDKEMILIYPFSRIPWLQAQIRGRGSSVCVQQYHKGEKKGWRGCDNESLPLQRSLS